MYAESGDESKGYIAQHLERDTRRKAAKASGGHSTRNSETTSHEPYAEAFDKQRIHEELIPSPLYYHKATNSIRYMADVTLNLTVSERLAALRLFDEFKGTLTQTASVLDDVKSLVVKDEKWEKVGLKKTPNQDGSTTWNWNDEGSEEDVKLSVEGVTYLKDTINKRSEKGEITLSEKALITISSKIN